MGLFERYLTVWVGLGIAAGVALGLVMPGVFQAVAALEVAQVNLVVAVFIWVMIYPMMIQIDWHAVKNVGQKPQGLLLTLVINWLIKPFTMAALGILFFQHVFARLGRPANGQRIHRRHDLARRGAVHGHGLRVEPVGEGRCELHPGAGLGERPHHGGCLCADCGVSAGRHRCHRALANAAALHRAVCGAATAGRHGHAPGA